MNIRQCEIPAVLEIWPDSIVDERGSFARLFCQNIFAEVGLKKPFVQINLSENKALGTFRGLHFQKAPFVDTKLVRCVQGSAIDIAVDLRKGSVTYLKSIQIKITASDKNSVLIPEGFAHGFITLEPNTTLLYHHTEFYNADADFGLNYADPLLALNLPIEIKSVSEKDISRPFLTPEFQGL